MATSTVELHTLVSASLGPEDCIDHYDNPYTALGKLQDAVKGKELGPPEPTEKPAARDINGIDWHEYDPPTALRKTPNVTSQILLDIIFTSIENVKVRVGEEQRLKKEAAEEAAEEAARRTAEEKRNAKGKEPYLPIVIPSEESPAKSSNTSAKALAPSGTTPDSIVSGGRGVPAKGEKRRKFALRNIFQRHPEGGESSAAGRAREALQHKLETKILSINPKSADPKTLEAIATFKTTKLFKTADQNALV